MTHIAIKVQNVSKQYRLGKIGTGSFAHDLNRWWHTVRGKADPYLKIGEVNERTQKGGSEYVWALKDISFSIKKGDVVGVIGRNGAGKSTLLKILSRTTLPTTGNIKVKGRIASLLEVGTGFHPELTGKENIFLNGAILGMRKREIQSKFDEIVDFSGVGKYIDTPVKRYSSGMYVRLAFAVAAHLDPEILVIDEVLAVGDAEFQKKCLGKMRDISGQGRTVLFVSHNMGAIQNLCKSCIVLRNGLMKYSGDVKEGVEYYLAEVPNNLLATADLLSIKRPSLGSSSFVLRRVTLLNSLGLITSEFKYGEPFSIQVEIGASEREDHLSLLIGIDTFDERRIFTCYSEESGTYYRVEKETVKTINAYFNNIVLVPGQYKVSLGIHKGKMGALDVILFPIGFVVNEIPFNKDSPPFKGNLGILKIDPLWS